MDVNIICPYNNDFGLVFLTFHLLTAYVDGGHISLFSLLSSAYDVVLRQKVAVKKLSRPFQSLIHSRRSYRELRLLKHMKHENVSAGGDSTQTCTEHDSAQLLIGSALLCLCRL